MGSRRGGGEGGGAETGAAAVRGAVAGWSAADWLSQRGELAAEIARVRERDGNGHVAHAIVATLAIFMQPIANAPANIGFGMLVAMCALRVHRLWRVWALMFREPFWLLLVAWAAWTGITLAWSEDFDYGFRQWTAFRAILWVPMLWPVIDRWRWLVGALLAGVAVGNCIQLSQYWFGWPVSRRGTQPWGLHMSTYMGVWCAVAFSIWMMLVVESRMWRAAASFAFAVLAATGLVLAGTRGAVVGVVFELVLLSAYLAIAQGGWLRKAALRLAFGLLIVAAVWILVGQHVESKFRNTVLVQAESVAPPASSVEEAGSGGAAKAGDAAQPVGAPGSTPTQPTPVDMGPDYRVVIWRFTMRQYGDAPLSGIGYGSVYDRAGRVPADDTSYTEYEHRLVPALRHPHSMWMQSLVETGVLGLGVLIAWSVATCVVGMRSGRSSSRGGISSPSSQPRWIAPGLLGGFWVFLAASQFDGYQMNATAFAIGLIPAALLTGLRFTPAR